MPDFIDHISPKIASIRQDLPRVSGQALYAAAEFVLGESNKIVPLETGEFERGGVASVDPERMIAAVSYRDTAFDGQAAKLHEDLDLHHDTGRQAKFLETAITSNRSKIGAILQNGLTGGIQ